MYSYKVVLRGGITKYYDGKVCEAINWLENTAYKSLWTTGTDLSSDGKLDRISARLEFDYEFIDRRSCAGYNIGKRTGYIEYFDKDREFLTRGGVFTDDWINSYIDLKMEEVTKMRMTPHPIEFGMYYSC